MEPRLRGTVMWVNPEKGFGFLKSPGNSRHYFRLADAPENIAKFDLVRFNSLPDSGKYRRAMNLEIETDATIAA